MIINDLLITTLQLSSDSRKRLVFSRCRLGVVVRGGRGALGLSGLGLLFLLVVVDLHPRNSNSRGLGPINSDLWR